MPLSKLNLICLELITTVPWNVTRLDLEHVFVQLAPCPNPYAIGG